MDNKNLKCKKINFSDYAEEIGCLRRKSWETVKGFDSDAFPVGMWLDDLDKSAIHWAVFDKKSIIASARLGIYFSYKNIPYMEMMKPFKSQLFLPLASSNRLVVCIDYRGQNISHFLDKVRVEEAKKNKVKTIVGQAVSNRIKGLQSLGFEHVANIGCIKELPNIELSLMIKQL